MMDAVEDYARRWIKREVDQDPELESLSDWVRTIRSLVQGRIHKLIVGSLLRRNDNIFVMKRRKTLNSFLVFKYRLRSTINTIFEVPKLHRTLCKERYRAGSSTSSTKLVSAVKEGQQKYCETVYSRSGIACFTFLNFV
jgi:hypothetical protein